MAGDQIWIAAGKYHPVTLANDATTATNEERAATFNIPTGVLVYGGFAGDEAALVARAGGETILSGDLLGDDETRPDEETRPAPGEDMTAYNAARTAYAASRNDNSNTVVTINDPGVTLDGLTITAGEGGTDLDGAGPNRNFGGAGLYAGVPATGITLTDCTFTGNESVDSGGGATFLGTATLTGCTFIGNQTPCGAGGGAYFEEETTLTSCIFTSNEANYAGGGGAYFEEEATLTGCIFTSNEAYSGGGLYFNSGGTIINLTLYNNTATERGGGNMGWI